MKFCPNCGNKSEGSRFCKNCGTPLSQDVATPFVNVITTSYDTKSIRSKSIEECERMYTYFSQKSAEYNEYDAANMTLDYLRKPNNKTMKYLGVFLIVLGLLSFLPLTTSNVTTERLMKTAFIGLYVIVVGIILLYLNYKKSIKYQKMYSDLTNRVSELSIELTDHYNNYGYCELGAEYTNPAIIECIRDYIRQGRADTIKEAINTMLNELHNRNMEEYAIYTAQETNRAARAAQSAAAFSAANLFVSIFK